MKKLKSILLLVLVFVAGLIAGVVGTRVVVRDFIGHALHEPDFLRTRVERDLTRQLKLDPTQQLRVQQVLREAESEIKAVATDARPRLAEVLLKANTDIEAVLTAEQLESYHQLQAKNRKRWDLR